VYLLLIAVHNSIQSTYQISGTGIRDRPSPLIHQLQSKLTSFLRVEEKFVDVRGLKQEETPLLKFGYLLKQNKLFKTWKKHWFVVQGNRIISFVVH
jgi:hypothetical protein